MVFQVLTMLAAASNHFTRSHGTIWIDVCQYCRRTYSASHWLIAAVGKVVVLTEGAEDILLSAARVAANPVHRHYFTSRATSASAALVAAVSLAVSAEMLATSIFVAASNSAFHWSNIRR